jgi:tetrahydromethanopterin S-methyltransferase subunit F
MSASGIKRGFSRLGIALAAPCLLSAGIASALALYTLATLPPARTLVSGPDNKVYEFEEDISNAEIRASLEKQYGRSPQDWETVRYSSQMWQRDSAFKAGLWAMASAMLAALAFLLSWTVGWVASGFVGDQGKRRELK